MVAFTSHRFTFAKKQKAQFFAVIDKYFRGVPAEVRFGYKKSNTESLSREWLCAPAGDDFYASECEEDTIVVHTWGISDNYALPQVLSPCASENFKVGVARHEEDVFPATLEEYVTLVSEAVAGTFHDIGYSVEYQHGAKIKDVDRYIPSILRVLAERGVVDRAARLPTPSSSLWLFTCGTEMVFTITERGVQWFYGPTFDIDDGFCPNVFDTIAQEALDRLNVEFRKWRAAFDATDGKNALEDIFSF